MSPTPSAHTIRPYRPEDQAAVAAVWHRAGLDAYPYLPTWQSLTLEHALDIFRDHIATRCQIWVGEWQGMVVAYLALDGASIERLYVDPPHQGRGWGAALLTLAKSLRPQGLELYTHQQNGPARAFYEKHGFAPVAFGVSPPPESAPDVLYRWQP